MKTNETTLATSFPTALMWLAVAALYALPWGYVMLRKEPADVVEILQSDVIPNIGDRFTVVPDVEPGEPSQ